MINLILGGKSNALWVARSLGKVGLRSFILDVEESAIAAESKFVDGSFIYDGNIDKFIIQMREIFGSTNIILYPTSDFWLEFIYQNKAFLRESGFCFFENKSSTIYTLLDKMSFYQVFSKEFLIPETVTCNTIFNRDFIKKPRKSFQGGKLISKGFEQYKNAQFDGGVLVKQEFINTPLYNHLSVSGLSQSGLINSMIFTRKVMEYPSPGGTATAVYSIGEATLCIKLRQLAESFIKYISYSGVFELEVLLKDNKLYIVEFNARFWLQHAMALPAGINFSLLYRNLLMDSNKSEDAIELLYSSDIKLLWLHEASLISFWKAPLKLKFKFIKTLLGNYSNITFGYFTYLDIKPFFKYIKCHILKN